MRRLWGATALLAVALLLGGCAVSVAASKVDEYHADAEELATEVVGLIPVGFDPQTPPDLQSYGRTLQKPMSSEQSPNDSVWWQVEAYVELAPRPGSSEASAQVLLDALVDEGWDHKRARETAQGRVITEGFHRDGWYLEVVWVTKDSGLAETIEVLVVSPNTTRGDHDEIYS